MIRVSQVCRRFRHVVALGGVSFEARDGSITGLLGPNGAGKTTLLRAMAGVVKPDGGRIDVDGIDVAGDPVGARRRLGALLDHTGFYERLSARENLEYFGKLRQVPAATLTGRIDVLVTELGLDVVADRRTAGFSQGERMKVALGRALVHNPPNLILDEPTNGLDVATVRTFRRVLRTLRDEGVCVILSSHVLTEIQQLCDRIVVVNGGKIVADGTVEEIVHRTGAESLEAAFVSLTPSGGASRC
jgi:sodium transport system ATP-binding protein